MENKITDINNLVLFLATTGMRPLLNDEIWRYYGYKKRPKKGDIWNKLFPKMFELENFIAKEILIIGLIDLLNGIKKSKETYDTKLLISIGVIDQFLSATKHLLSADLFMEDLFSAYASYLKSNKSNLHKPIILKAKDVLNKKDFAKFMVGTIKLFTELFTIECAGNFLLKSNYVEEIIEKSSKEHKLKISMSKKMYRKYVPLLEEKILNV
jgi:hypothetical protein